MQLNFYKVLSTIYSKKINLGKADIYRFLILSLFTFYFSLSINTTAFAQTNEGKELFEKNCSVCHVDSSLVKQAPPLLQASSKLKKTWFVNWLVKPTDYLKKSRMPTYNLKLEEANAISDYILDNSDDSYGKNTKITTKKELIPEGKRLYKEKGCFYCHDVTISGSLGGPALNKIGNKTNAKWLFNWLKNPRSYHPTTTMPSPAQLLSEQETIALVSWLESLKTTEETLKTSKIDYKKGKSLTEKYACASCHKILGVSFTNIIKLDKKYKYKYGNKSQELIKTITNGIKNTAMPSWKASLSQEEIEKIALYLTSK